MESFFHPKVLFIGKKQPQLKTQKYFSYESDVLCVKYLNDDSRCFNEIIKFDPDVIVTNSSNWQDFPSLVLLPIDYRKRWVHLENIDEEKTGEMIYRVAMNYILGQKNKPETISYFTPVYNIKEKILQTYQSLKNQTNINWEWVLVNDSSDKETLPFLEKIKNGDLRIKLFDFSNKTKGILGEAKYRAASLCTGNILAELDHDDYLMPSCTQTLLNASKKYPQCGFFYTDCAEFNNQWQSLTYGESFAFGYGSYREEKIFNSTQKICQTPNINPKTIRHIVSVPNHIRAWRKETYFETGGHNRRLAIADDYELLVRTFLKTLFLKIPKMEYIQFIDNKGNNTHNLRRADIQRRVRFISQYYNEPIKKRFEELGLEDWAYKENPSYPLYTPSQFNKPSANLIYVE